MKAKKILAIILSAIMLIGTMTTIATAEGTTLPEVVDGKITLTSNVELTDTYTVPAGTTLTIDLNGKTITYNSTIQGEAMITNKGNLTIKDSGETGVINYNYTGAADSSYGKGNYTISNAGTLTVDGGKITIANLSGHAKYPIDNNSTTGDAILVINGGHLYNYNTSAIRQFCNSTTNKNSVTINGGLIEGYSAIWVQNPGKNTVNGSLSITGGEIRTTAKAWVNGTYELKDVSSRIYCTIAGAGGAWSDDSAVSITGGIINENVSLLEEAPAAITLGEEATFNGYVTAPAAYVAQVGDVKYTDIQEAIKAAKAGDTVTIKEGRYALPSMKAGITVVGEGEVILEGTLTGTLEDLTMKNLHIKGGNAQRWAYAKGNLLFEDVTFEATSVYALHFDGITEGATLLYKDCTIIGWAAMSGSPASFVFDGCAFKDNGTYGVIRTYFDAEIKNCEFDVDGANTEDVYEDGIHAVDATVKVNNCTNVNGDMKDILNISNEAYIYVDDVLVLAPAKTYNVGTKDELDAAIAAAQDGDTILLTDDIDYTGATSLEINKALTLNLGGYILTTNGTYGGLKLKGNCSLKNGTLAHKGTVTAIKAWNVEAIEDLVIDVAFKAEGKIIGGIVIQEGSTNRIGTIKNVTIKGEGLTNGIETYNCGNATEDVIGSMDSVTIDAKDTGMLISAPCGTATNCDINGGTTGINLLLKGTYSATLGLVDCDVEGGTQALWVHDEGKGYNYDGLIKLEADDASTFKSENGEALKYEVANEEDVELSENIIALRPVAKVGVAKIGDKTYETLTAALAAAQPNDTITLLANVEENVTINKNITLDGANKQYTGAIEISGNVKVAIKNVNFVGGTGYAVTTKSINTVTFENCNVKDYTYGFLYAPKSTANVVIKDVNIDNCAYGFHWYYGTNATLENVKMTNVTYGVRVQNHAHKTVTFKNCEIFGDYPIAVWEKNTANQTFKFEGTNNFGTTEFEVSTYAILQLADADATLTACEGLNITTNLDGCRVVYENDTYSVENFDAVWYTNTDAGFYMETADGKVGMMRFLFAADVAAEEVISSGIKYIKVSDITDRVNATGVTVSGNAAAFYGDIIEIPEESAGTYVAVAYVTTKDGTFWSEAVECATDFEKDYTDYLAQ